MTADMTHQYYLTIVERLNNIINARNLTQTEISRMCAARGFNIPQGTISKILNYGKNKEPEEGEQDGPMRKTRPKKPIISLANVVCICDVLDLELSNILRIDRRSDLAESRISKMSQKYETFIYDPNHHMFNGHLGKFYCYFYPTKSNENELLCGELVITHDTDTDRCAATMSLKTRMVNEQTGQPLKKIYTGDFFMSNYQRVCYCLLRNESLGELNLLVFHHQQINLETLLCKMASVVTTSSGGNPLPTTHRMLLTRKELATKEELDVVRAQLLQNSKNIFISEQALNEIREKLPPHISDLLGREIKPEPYYHFKDSDILNRTANFKEGVEALCLLRNSSVAERYNKIGPKADEIVFKYLYT